MKIYMETERLILRSWKYEDRKPFAEMNGNGNVMRYFPATLTADESDAFVDRIDAEFKRLFNNKCEAGVDGFLS